MNKAFALVLALLGASAAAGVLTAAPEVQRFAPHQEPRGIGNLVARGDRVQLVYDADVKSATSSVWRSLPREGMGPRSRPACPQG